MQPIEIARVTDNGKFIVDNDRLFELFNPLQDKDLYIISVAGSYRTGKSFMLNFFIRYLREKGWDNRSWFGDDDKRLRDGFDWKRGSDPHTKGINVWPEVFDVPLRNGKHASVMIVDTQGLFDNDNTPDTNAKIMSISTLLCSHQILNIQNRIQERDLEHLQLSVEYACAAVGLQSDRGSTRKQRTTFQRLTFLIRDWINDDEYPYGDGGNEYLDSILRKKSKSKKVNEVKDSVHQAFEEVKGFLMPHPGKKVIRGDKSNLVNSDMEPEFREYTIKLAEAVLHPRNLILKQMFGKPISSSALMNLLAAVSNSFRDGRLPEVGTMLENTVRANNDEAVQRAVQRYREKMAEFVQNGIFTDDVLQDFHVKSLGEATAKFYEISTLGEEQEKESAHQHAMKECDDYYGIVKQENDTRKSKEIEEMNNLCSALEARYRETMKHLDLSALTKEELVSENESVCKTLLHEFDRANKSREQIMPDVVRGKRSVLKQSLISHYETLERERYHQERNREIDQQMDELKISQIASDIYSELQKAMARYQDKYCLDIESLFREEFEKCFAKYDSKTQNFEEYDKIQDTRKKLSEDMKLYFNDHVQRVNENNKRHLGLKYDQHIETALESYDNLMKEITANGNWEEDKTFEKKHHEVTRTALQNFDGLITDLKPGLPSENVQEYRRKLSRKMDERYSGVHKQTNDNNRHLQEMKEKMDNVQAANYVEQASRFYETEMNKLLSNGGSCENLRSEHERFKKLAENKFQDMSASINCNTSEYLRSLNKVINERFQTFETMNKTNMNALIEKQKREYATKAVYSYERSMQEYASKDSSQSDKFLSDKHEELKSDAISGFTRALKENVTEEDKSDLRKQIEDKFSIFKNQNETKREREKLKELENVTNKSQIEGAKNEAYNSFVSRMGQFTDKYVSNIERHCESEKTAALNLFEQKTVMLKTKEGLESVIHIERSKLTTEIDAHSQKTNQINDKNKERKELEQKNLVDNQVNIYQSRLNEALSNVHVTDATIDACESKFLQELAVTLRDYPASVLQNATTKIQEKTRITKRKNEEDKKHRAVEVKEEGFLDKAWNIGKAVIGFFTSPVRAIGDIFTAVKDAVTK